LGGTNDGELRSPALGEKCADGGSSCGKYYITPGAGFWYEMPTVLQNANVNELEIPKGYMVEYYSHPLFEGWDGQDGSHDELIRLDSNLWEPYAGTDRFISSFKVKKLPEGKVRLCMDSDCSSDFMDINRMKVAGRSDCVFGDYPPTVQKIQVPRGYKFFYSKTPANVGCISPGCSGRFGSCNESVEADFGDWICSYEVRVLECNGNDDDDGNGLWY